MSSPPDTPPSGTCTRRRLLVAAGALAAVAGACGTPDAATPNHPAAAVDPIMDDFGDLPFPRTTLAGAATRLAASTEDPAIFHHSMRTYLYGRVLGRRQGVEPGRDYDDELLYLGCVLHDLGLGTRGTGAGRFELDGADLARQFAVDNGVPAGRADIIWDAVTLHTSPDIAERKRPEIGLVSLGAGFDLGGDPAALPAGYSGHVHRWLPRLHAAVALHDTIVAQAVNRPEKAPPFTLAGELVRQQTGTAWPSWRDIAGSPGWGDY